VTLTVGGVAHAEVRPDEPAPPVVRRRAAVPDIVRRRLVPFDPRNDPMSWLATGFVVVVAAALRFGGLAHPPGKVFDETYYAREAYGLLDKGVEWNYKDNVAGYVVHPPLGKWLVAIGEWAFGYQDVDGDVRAAGHIVTTVPEFGWRFSAAVAGVLSVLLAVRIGRRLFGSTVLGCAAGLLLTIDGFHLVLSRTALLDIFLLLFVLATFGALLVDRDARRRRWLAALEAGEQPASGVPWWRLLAAVLFASSLAIKWSALFFLPVFVLLILWWDAGARRTAGARRPWRDALVGEARWLAAYAAIVFAVYLASWSGWLLTDDGFYRHWLADNGRAEPPVIGALQNLFHYHHEAFKFHSTLQAGHQNQSWPWQWLLLGQPVALYLDYQQGQWGTAPVSEVLLLGTPVLWWSFIPALLATLWLGIARRDWRAGAILLVTFAGFAPWFYYALDASRTMFSFYTAPVLPFMVFAVVYVLGALMAPEHRRFTGAVVAGAYLVLVTLCFAYFYRLFVGEPLTYADWAARMWLGSRWHP
jgi:dolichyl-phosphate-mannose--protein O-mannosyl transferase